MSENKDSIVRDKTKVKFTDKDNLKFFPDNPTEEKHKDAFRFKDPSKYYNPCEETAQMSLKCLERNNFDHDSCLKYFYAYRDCKKTWMRERKSDRGKGVYW